MNNSKSVFFIIVIAIIFLAVAFIFPLNTSKDYQSDDFLRIHIRANSNSVEDQNVKYKVRDEIINTLSPILAQAETKEQATTLLNENMYLIIQTANTVLQEHGFNYGSNAEIRCEYFPTRTYDTLTLESDYYDALIVELGNGTGDNWWCVAYPPMCFVNGDNSQNIEYKSRLLEIIHHFFG